MERFNLKYSKKNIPIPSESEYKLLLTAKTESLIKRMRWKALQFQGKLQPSDKETYGFKSKKCPPVVNELSKFEEDLMKIIKNIEFRNVNNEFQKKMKEDMKNIKTCGKVVVPADKSTNLYKVDKETYENHITNNITKTYKKSNEAKIAEIDKAASKIASKLKLDDRMERLQKSEAYITAKDHKENFPINPTFRLINPAKTDIGKVSKTILDRINRELLLEIKVNQWKSTKVVIDWFKNIKEKPKCTFIKFDVDNFYPSITEELFNKGIRFARQHVNISDNELNIILQARKTLLHHNDQPWTKKDDQSEFDVPMGSYDGAEVAELVGAYMLWQTKHVITKENMGLYRDDGLGIMKGIGRPEMERKKKALIRIFKQHKLNITVETGIQSVDYLDVVFDLKNNTYKPYRKPGNEPLYVHIDSNHPQSVLKQIPKGIARRLSDISSNERVFENSKIIYKEALEKSGFTDELEFTENVPPQRRGRKRKIIWYNPPFSMNVKTNLGKEFLKLLNTHFHRQHAFRKIFNKNTVKLSYSCTKNVASIISSHNRKILNTNHPETRSCNCRNKDSCPLNNQCLTKNIVYEAKIETEDTIKFYRGLCSTTFKERLAVHNQHINHWKHRNKCELAKYAWELKSQNKDFNISWKILKKVQGRLVGGACRLCTTEKLSIIEHPDPNNLLNSNCITKCRHGDKYTLSNVSNGQPNPNVDTMD